MITYSKTYLSNFTPDFKLFNTLKSSSFFGGSFISLVVDTCGVSIWFVVYFFTTVCYIRLISLLLVIFIYGATEFSTVSAIFNIFYLFYVFYLFYGIVGGEAALFGTFSGPFAFYAIFIFSSSWAIYLIYYLMATFYSALGSIVLILGTSVAFGLASTTLLVSIVSIVLVESGRTSFFSVYFV